MIDKFLKNSNFKLLCDAINEGYNCSVFGLNKGEKLALLDSSEFLFYVVDTLDGVDDLREKMVDLGRTPLILREYISPLSSEFEKCEIILGTLYKIKTKQIDTLIITPQILCATFPNPSMINGINIQIGDELDITKFIKNVVSLGYRRVDLVSEVGEFSVRGDVVDIYPLGGVPTRIMADFDMVDSIRNYNPITLLSTTEEKECIIPRNKYYNVDANDIEKYYSDKKIKKDDLFYELTSSVSNNDYRYLVFDKNYNSSIFDYVDNSVIAFDGAKNIYDILSKYIDEYNLRLNDSSLRKLLDKKNIGDILKFNEKNTLVAFHYIQQNNRLFKPQKVFSIRTLPATNYTGHDNVLLLDMDNYCKQGYTIILCGGTNEQANRLSSVLNGKNIKHNLVGRIALCQAQEINIVIRKFPLDIILPEDKLVVVSYTSLFGKKKKIIESASSFVDGEVPTEGDYVVHSFHGIGRCLGVKTLNISTAQRDYVVVEYKNNDKLYLPVENLNQLSKYMGSDKTPTINKIGGVEFARTKEKIKSAVKKIAFDLITLYRERTNKRGFQYPQDDALQKSFEDSFAFSETADQLKAIDECKSDMESAKVMDRLVCGDVGYGKTEVALRIAFKTILSGKQVVFLCPTTILSEQHYNTAKARMSDFGVKVEVLNRLRSKSDEQRIKQEFADGKIDMLCGTHKLLASDMNYNNLGLLILDEEQKFGVADKEKIKNLRKSVNVLTLSATPIPRTLNMSLIGVRDISVIETPPVERIASDVQVVEYNETLIKLAIDRELERGGQVLVIYNRVEKIYNFASKIKALVPNAIVSVAHGQMSETELEKEILNLYSGKTQVLVATTLIENGVDLPNANTLIVINSDMLGLSQLYQLKGRIGRSDKSSYAYFTFDNRKMLTDNAYKRLQAIKEFSGMGSGFKIAMRDLEIRGAGSLLGAEQSGHIEKVGYNMYIDLLNEGVKELKGEKVSVCKDIKVETIYPAFLPHDYIDVSSIRMAMYRDISNINTVKGFSNFVQKTEGVYGALPRELNNLCKIALIKNRLGVLGVERVAIKKKISIYFASREYLTPQVIDIIKEYSDIATLNLSAQPVVEILTPAEESAIDILLEFSLRLEVV